MAITLPHWLVEVVDFLGFNWPEIDEDQMHEGARHLRQWADETEQTLKSTHTKITVDIAAVYQAQSFVALADVWEHQTKGHMETLIEGARLLADGIDLAADGVVAMKGEILAALALACEEFAADQAASVATVGLAETALPLLYETQNRILNMIIQRFEAEVVDYLIDHTIGPVKDRMVHALDKLLFDEAAEHVVGPPSDGLKISLDAIDAHADEIGQHALAHQAAGRALVTKLSGLNYTTG